MKLIKVLSICCFLRATCFAGGYFAEFGVEINPRAGGFSNSKNIEFGYVGKLSPERGIFQFGLGGWSHDGLSGYTKPSLYVYGGAGIEPTANKNYLNYVIGPSLISSPDSYLSSYYQFFQETGMGVRDVYDTRIGIVFKHLSNAGLKKPNAGRNFLTIRAQVGL
jgi:hypothetical protein